MTTPTFTIRDLFKSSFARYVRVLPGGLEMYPGKILSSISATIVTFQPARTLYQNRQPVCRSLDGIQSIKEGRACASCLMRKTCTPQIYLQLLWNHVPLRLMLAYTSARNFMTFVSTLREKGCPIENSTALINVRDRGRWGEVRFICAISEESQ